MSKTIEEMATEVVEAWIAGQSSSGEHIAKNLKIIYKAMIEAYRER